MHLSPVLLLFLVLATAPTLAAAGDADRGRYLVTAAGCPLCHTDTTPGAAGFAGGRALESSYGTYYAPNITPDPETGIGRFSEADFLAALREGKRAAGGTYFPVFPYVAYAGLTDEDARDIYAYLQTVPAVKQANQRHRMAWYLRPRAGIKFWRRDNFVAGTFTPDAARSDDWNRGAYLVRHLAHCGECHTPRGRFGGLRRDQELAGNPDGPARRRVPNITPHVTDGIGAWTQPELETFLATGMRPDGDFAGAGMGDVIDRSLALLTAADRAAIATYLRSVPPLPGQP